MSKNNYVKKQLAFIKALEGIGDVLVFDTKRRNKNKSVIGGLAKINAITKKFLDIQQHDPGKFEKLLLAQEYFDIYSKNESDAKFRLAFNPEKYLVSFSTVINQILRIHRAAIEAKNDEISRFATYHINYLLADISQSGDYGIFVEQLLKSLTEITILSIDTQDRSMYASSIQWYIDIVFNRLRQKEGEFNIKYLELFNKYFLRSVKYIISNNQSELFNYLVSSLVDGVHIPTYNSSKIWEYAHQIYGIGTDNYNIMNKEHHIDERLKELSDSEDDLNTQDKLDAWIKNFHELKYAISKHITSTQEDKFNELESEIVDYVVTSYKYTNLLELVFSIGTYCLFKNKPEYIRYLWEYKQPPDSDATWVGHEIIPNTIKDIIKLYFENICNERKSHFLLENHHGSEKYLKEYFLLLLARVIRSSARTEEQGYPELNNVIISGDFSIFQLSNIEHSVDDLVNIAKELKEKKRLLLELGFDDASIDDLFGERINTFLGTLKTNVKKRIQNIHDEQRVDAAKIDDFKNKFLDGFYKNAIARDIFTKYLNLYEDKTGDVSTGYNRRIGIKNIDDKAAFLKEWHVHYLDWGEQYGRNLANGETHEILNEISSICQEIRKEEIERILESYDNIQDTLIVSSGINLYKYFETSQSYKPNWKNESARPKINSFDGWYCYRNTDIPIFSTYGGEKRFFILNKFFLGKIVQYSPINKTDNPELKRDIFYIDVQALSENITAMEELIKESPTWLQKKGDTEKQREYLKSNVIIKIHESFKFLASDNFKGYIIKGNKQM